MPPNLLYCRVISTLFAVSFSLGCLPRPKDIAAEPQIQELHLMGRCFVLKADAPLIKIGQPYPRLVLQADVQPECGGPGKQIGIVRAGTQLRVVRIERAITYWDGFFSASSEIAFGRIQSGEHAGKVIDLDPGCAPVALPKANETPGTYAPCPDGR